MEESARTVYRVRAVRVLDGRDYVNSYTAPGAKTEADVIVQPTTGREDQTGGRDATMAQFMVMDQDSPAGFWRDSDRLEMDGVQYQIEGHVHPGGNELSWCYRPHAIRRRHGRSGGACPPAGGHG